MKTYGVGIIGCGRVSQYHREAVGRAKRVKCTQVYDPVADRAEETAKETGARVAASAEALLRSGDVDIVSVLTPAYTHAGLVEAGAAAGKHFMLEKPMAASLEDAERIVRAVRDAGVRCFHPTLRALGSDLFEKLKELTSPDGPLGPVKGGFYTVMGLPFGWASWFEERGKCLPYAEYGSHVFDTLMALTGEEAESVWCHSGRFFREFDQDDVNTIIVRFPSGGYFRMSIDWVMKPEWEYSESRFHLLCERGLIEHQWFGAKWRTDDEKGEFTSQRRSETQGWRWEHYDALAEAIDSGTDCSPNERDGLRYMRIVGAALKSSETGVWETVEPVGSGGAS